MRIGINALYLIPGGVGGTEIYLRSLLHALAQSDGRNEYIVFINRETASDPPPPAANMKLVPCPVTANSRPLRILWEQIAFPVLLGKWQVDVLFNPGFTMPVCFSGPSATVFHDLQHKQHPEFFRWFDLPFWNLLLWAAARRSRALIAVSHATADALERYYPGTASKTVTIPHGVDPRFFEIGKHRARNSNRERYILTVSTLHPHKNIARLMEAFKVFRKSHPEFRLIAAGRKGFATTELETRRAELDLEGSVTFTGWLPRETLYDLYLHADCYIAPSAFEGFGMTIIEALAAGIPAACSGIPPMSGIAGTAAAQFDPHSTPSIVSAMEHICCHDDFRALAAIAGPERARHFSWAAAAAQTRSVLENLAQ